MRIAVVGAGIIGVTSVYELAALGHEVTVFERRGSVAAEASFANAGVIAPGYVTPWAAPGMPLKVLRQMFGRDAALRLGGSAFSALPWIWQWWRACSAKSHTANRSAMQRLAHFSRGRLLEITHALGLEYGQQAGFMVLLRGATELRSARAGMKLLAELGVAFKLVDAARARVIEPALNPATPLQAAIHLPNDGVGNCRQFTHLLKAEATRLGAIFRFDCAVRALVPGRTPRVELARGGGEDFGAVVLCAGVEANALLAPLGLRLPLQPVYGYSLTAPVRHHDDLAPTAPVAALMDERYKVAISRLGQRVRVAGTAELGGKPDDMRAAALATLYRVLDDWFPGAVSLRDVQQWKGARPMLPDGPPVLGRAPWPGIWVNLGHGSSGWALACGSARIVAELISGRAAPIDTTGLGLERLR